jgi:hypothetical protein
MRLGIGEFYFSGGPKDIAVWFAQNQFLEAVRSTAPEVVATLRDKVRRLYWPQSKLTNSVHETGTLPDWKHLKPLNLRHALFEWASSYNLAADWVLDTAVHTLWYWEQFPQAATQLRWALLDIELHDTSETRSRFMIAAFWDPLLEPWKQFDQNVRAKFEVALKQFRTRTEGTCLEAGAKRTPQKRLRSSPDEIHFRCLVHYQCRRLSLRRIADLCNSKSETLSEDAVRKGIVKTARLIDLHLRSRK